eukprot:TRINITY_DN3979_c0_g1_i1.p1 TRINITY_DN3979_c0_g1~~TRINITY_DN3979_c0_g1_i1.p1  ORF type:complete len:163 (-),score=19.72 TRINITY_DN3979_c0_g1_i1:303-791(-)
MYYAVKRYPNIIQCLNEAEIILSFRPHCNIVGIVGIVQGDRPGILMEYMAGGALVEWVKDVDRPLLLFQSLQFGLDIAQAVNHLHKEGIIYRDLALRNILVYQDHGKYHVKLTDFDWSVRPNQDDKISYIKQTISGPWRVYAPESCEYGVFTPASGEIIIRN